MTKRIPSRSLLTLVLVAFASLARPAIASAAPIGVVASYDFANTPYAATNNLETRVNVTQNAPSQSYAVLWSHMFGGNGAMALQSNGRMPVSNRTRNLFRYTLWGTTNSIAIGPGAECATYRDRVECAMPYAFATNRWYWYRVKDAGADAVGRWWEAAIQDEASGVWTTLARIRTTTANRDQFIASVRHQTESFAQNPPFNCAAIQRSEVIFVVPFGAPNGGFPARFLSTVYPSNPCANGSSVSGYGAVAMRMGY